MALIEEYHVIADMYPVDPATNPLLEEGKVVQLNSAGNAVLATETSRILGLAGDSSEGTTGHTPFAADLVIGAHQPGQVANTQSTANRVSDMFDETLASGKVTVYTGGGKFHTDQLDVADTFVPGTEVFSNADGDVSNVDGTGWSLGMVVVAPRAYPSGVPGTDTVDGSLSLGSFLTLVLMVAVS